MPSPVSLADLSRSRPQPGVPVKEFPLGIRSYERLMGVLSVNIHQTIADFAHLRNRRGPTVDECARPSAGVDNPPQDQPPGIALERLILEPARYRGMRINGKFRGDFGALGPFSYLSGICSLAQCKRKRID